jgi:hypothetical protein
VDPKKSAEKHFVFSVFLFTFDPSPESLSGYFRGRSRARERESRRSEERDIEHEAGERRRNPCKNRPRMTKKKRRWKNRPQRREST